MIVIIFSQALIQIGAGKYIISIAKKGLAYILFVGSFFKQSHGVGKFFQNLTQMGKIWRDIQMWLRLCDVKSLTSSLKSVGSFFYFGRKTSRAFPYRRQQSSTINFGVLEGANAPPRAIKGLDRPDEVLLAGPPAALWRPGAGAKVNKRSICECDRLGALKVKQGGAGGWEQ